VVFQTIGPQLNFITRTKSLQTVPPPIVLRLFGATIIRTTRGL